MKKMSLTILIITLSLRVFAPIDERTIIFQGEPIAPFKHVWIAVGMTEASGDRYAYNPVENAVGIGQIRQVRLDDYNKRTGNNYKLSDMYDPELSKKVFMYYADPYQIDNSIRAWNGSGAKTYEYLKKVKKYL
jgi:hypothetical protein